MNDFKEKKIEKMMEKWEIDNQLNYCGDCEEWIDHKERHNCLTNNQE